MPRSDARSNGCPDRVVPVSAGAATRSPAASSTVEPSPATYRVSPSALADDPADEEQPTSIADDATAASSTIAARLARPSATGHAPTPLVDRSTRSAAGSA